MLGRRVGLLRRCVGLLGCSEQMLRRGERWLLLRGVSLLGWCVRLLKSLLLRSVGLLLLRVRLLLRGRKCGCIFGSEALVALRTSVGGLLGSTVASLRTSR